MPKVLVLFEFPTVNGGENSWLATVDHLRGAGWDIVTAAPAHGPLAALLHQRQLEHWPLARSTRDGRTHSLAARREGIADVIRRCQADLVHANSLNMARLAGPVARDLVIPGLGHLRDIVRLSKQAVADLNQNARLICVSEATKKWHVAQGLRADRAVVLYNGVDLNLFRPRASTRYLHDELGLDRRVQIIGGVGQLIVRKGWDLLMEAADRLVIEASGTERAALHFVIAGQCYSTKDEAQFFHRRLQQETLHGPLSGHVSLLGRRDDVANLMSELAILVHPARQEPLGRVLLEAVACGVPVVATDVGGTPEIFADYSDAAKIVPAEATELAAAMREALADSAWRSQARRRARCCAEARFDQRMAAQALDQQYAAVLAAERGPSFRGPSS